MSDLIDRDTLLDAFDEDEPGEFSFVPLYELRNVIKKQPTVGPVKHGHWEAINKDGRGYADAFECSACHLVTTYPYFTDDCDYEYCPHCGAAMDEETKK